jgi:hypothetical protein
LVFARFFLLNLGKAASDGDFLLLFSKKRRRDPAMERLLQIRRNLLILKVVYLPSAIPIVIGTGPFPAWSLQ